MVWTFSICLSPHSCTTRIRPLDAERHRAVGRQTKLIGAQGAVEIRRYPAAFGSTATGEELHPNILHFGVPWNILKLFGHGNVPTNQQEYKASITRSRCAVKGTNMSISPMVYLAVTGSLLLTTSCNIPQQWDDNQMTTGTIQNGPKISKNGPKISTKSWHNDSGWSEAPAPWCHPSGSKCRCSASSFVASEWSCCAKLKECLTWDVLCTVGWGEKRQHKAPLSGLARRVAHWVPQVQYVLFSLDAAIS